MPGDHDTTGSASATRESSPVPVARAALDEAAARAPLLRGVPHGVRLRWLKRCIRRLNRQVMTEEADFNRAALAVMEVLAAVLTHMRDTQLRTLEERAADLEQRAADLAQRLLALEGSTSSAVDELRRADDELAASWRRSQAELLIAQSRFDVVAREARRRLPEPLNPEQLRSIAATMRDGFPDLYASFEARFRGSRAEVRRRVTAYLPDIDDLRRGQAPVCDLGPGRCEWLELLRDEEIPAYGVDTSPTFVELGRQLGLDVRLTSATDHLDSIEEATLGAVTAFHIAEHLPFDELVTLVDAALRALRPGGLLLIETPNPKNVAVGSADFYLDPTHGRPLHPLFLRFLVENRGFEAVEIREMNALPEAVIATPDGDGPESETIRRLVHNMNSLLATAPDYSVLGRRPMA